MTTRITESTRQKLERAATASQRSLSQEIEFRLEQSLAGGDIVPVALSAAWGPRTAGMMVLIGRLLGGADQAGSWHDKGEWPDDAGTFRVARMALGLILDAVEPKQSASSQPWHGAPLLEAIRLRELVSKAAIADPVKSLLGEALVSKLASKAASREEITQLYGEHVLGPSVAAPAKGERK